MRSIDMIQSQLLSATDTKTKKDVKIWGLSYDVYENKGKDFGQIDLSYDVDEK